MGDRVTKPQFMRDLEEDYTVAQLEAASLTSKLAKYRATTRNTFLYLFVIIRKLVIRRLNFKFFASTRACFCLVSNLEKDLDGESWPSVPPSSSEGSHHRHL